MTQRYFMGKKNPAYTLFELIIVIVILGILSSIGFVNYLGAIEKGRAAEAYSTLAQIVAAEKSYFLEYGNYTTDLTQLDIFSSIPQSDNFTFAFRTDLTPNAGVANRKTTAGCSYKLDIDGTKAKNCSGTY